MQATEALSVIIPAWNAGEYLQEAVESIESQEYPGTEIIVVDDGSTDDTADLCSRLPVKLIRQNNRGAAAARNTGLKAARGDLIAFLDADDRWAPQKIAVQLCALKEQPVLAMVLGLSIPFRNSDEELSDPMFLLLLGTALIRRRAFDAIGDFDTALAMGEDTDWFLRAAEQQMACKILPDTVLHYRRHSSNITTDRDSSNRFLVRALKMSLDRRRASAGGTVENLILPEFPENALTETYIRETKDQ